MLCRRRRQLLLSALLAALAAAPRGAHTTVTSPLQFFQEGPAAGGASNAASCTTASPGVLVTSNFDGGNAVVFKGSNPSDIQVAIAPDPYSVFDNTMFLQAWAFRVAGVKGKTVNVTIVNAKLANAGGDDVKAAFEHYKARYSYDRKKWFTANDTSFNKSGDSEVNFKIKADKSVVYFAYAPLYGYEDSQRWLAGLAAVNTSVPWESKQIGWSNQRRPVDLVTIGTPGPRKLKVWFTARSHPGETYGSWWVEGLVDRLLKGKDAATKKVLEEAVVYVVPALNVDSVSMGFYRTSPEGSNFNRVWDSASPSNAAALWYAQQAMKATGVDFFLDIHTDESERCAFIFWPAFGVKGAWSKELMNLTDAFDASYKKATPLFENYCRYPPDPVNGTPPIYGDSWVTSTFKAPGGTLEMPMTELEKRAKGQWTPERSFELGSKFVDAFPAVIPRLRAYRKRAHR